MKSKLVILEIAASMIMMLMMYAVLSKFLSFHQFVGEIDNQPLPNSWTPVLVWSILLAELLISALLIFEKTRTKGFLCCLVLLSLFSIYILIILFNGFPYVPCSCAGPFPKLNWSQHLVINLCFIFIAITGAILQRQKSSSKRQ